MSTIKSKKTKTYIDAGVNIDIGDQSNQYIFWFFLFFIVDI